MSSCQYGCVQPPWAKPPSVSSSAPPGACMTPSNETNSDTTILRMVISLLSADPRAAPIESTGAPPFEPRRARRNQLLAPSSRSATSEIDTILKPILLNVLHNPRHNRRTRDNGLAIGLSGESVLGLE